MSKPYKILVVCKGNVCRSVAAHHILRELAVKSGIHLRVISAGMDTAGVSNDADASTAFTLQCIERLLGRYVQGPHERRQFSQDIITEYTPDMILAVDNSILDKLAGYNLDGIKVCNLSDFSRREIVDINPDQEQVKSETEKYIASTVQQIYDATLNFMDQLPSLTTGAVQVRSARKR